MARWMVWSASRIGAVVVTGLDEMTDQGWLDDLARGVAGEASRRGALRRIGAVLAATALGVLAAPRASADDAPPPRDNANCGEVGNACPAGSSCVRGTEAGFPFESGVCVCEGGGNARGLPCGATSPISGAGRVFVGGTCCKAPTTCANDGTAETCVCGSGANLCPATDPLTCCPAGSKCCVALDGKSATCCPATRDGISSNCVAGTCNCVRDRLRTKMCNGVCCTSASHECVDGRCRCERDNPILCGRTCFPDCKPVNGVPHFLSQRTCICQPCPLPNKPCPGLNACLPPCPASKARDPETCECKTGLCRQGGVPCGYLLGDKKRHFCCPSGASTGPGACEFIGVDFYTGDPVRRPFPEPVRYPEFRLKTFCCRSTKPGGFQHDPCGSERAVRNLK